jgi:hypothetical protein
MVVRGMVYGPIYINLDHRTDRRIVFEGECKTLGLDPIRCRAEYTPKHGSLGCLRSHLNALSSGSYSEPTWICEDDCTFLVPRETLDAVIGEFLESSADILCLAFASRKDLSMSPLLKRTTDCQTASSYIVKPAFRKVLLTFWQSVLECKENESEHPRKPEFMRLSVHKGEFETTDQSWKLLQQSHVFVIPKIRCAKQRESYSDIEHMNVNYNV